MIDYDDLQVDHCTTDSDKIRAEEAVEKLKKEYPKGDARAKLLGAFFEEGIRQIRDSGKVEEDPIWAGEREGEISTREGIIKGKIDINPLDFNN